MSASENPLRASVDLRSCAQEPIHIPGRIQPHGILLALDEADLFVLQVSRNVGERLGIEAEALLGESVARVLGEAQAARLRDDLTRHELAELNPMRLQIPTGGRELVMDGVLHRTGGMLILELEPGEGAEEPSFSRFYHRVRGSVSRLQQAADILELSQRAAEEFRAITGFDRVMIYRFDEQWNGEVIAEARAEQVESFLGLHYPASDIPEQARRLYTVNWLRLIVDVNYQPAELVPVLNPRTGAPLDLSGSTLRSVSPVHLQYLKNMGVGASMSVSLIKNGKLWGLIACHHEKPRHVPYVVRNAGEFLGQALSLQLTLREEQDSLDYTRGLRSIYTALVRGLSAEEDLQAALVGRPDELLGLVRAGGAALCFGEDLELVGETPSRLQAHRLIEWLDETEKPDVYHTSCLAELWGPGHEVKDSASGLLSLTISRRNRILWFRPEVVRTVNWSGDPNKPVRTDASGTKLHPRNSFELWKQTVRLQSPPWRPEEIAAAEELRGTLVDLILRQQEEQARQDLERLNAALARSNAELDQFAFIASHDLKEPLRGIQQFSTFLREDYADRLDEEGRTRLETVARLSQRMQDLIDALLRYSRLGRVELAMRDTDLNEVLQDVRELLALRLEDEHVELRVPRPLPTVHADRPRIQELYHNLVTNAIKYNDKAEKWIEVGYREAPEEHPEAPYVFYVRDNGIGIQPRHLNSVFDMFRRLHPRDRYGGGTGAGLSVARKIVSRHGGRLWVESEPGVGSTFYFTLGQPD